MLSHATLSVYEASAGAGKTYSLVREYLALVLASQDSYTFKNLLAITFTNKAAFEIRVRILESLREISEPAMAPYHPFFEDFLKEFNCSPMQLISRAAAALKAILHTFSDFSISTIDKFTHKIVRAFAADLNLARNFELEIDSHFLLQEAIERFLSKMSPECPVSIFLVEFSFENLQQGRIWDPSAALLETTSLLLMEESVVPVQKLKRHTLSDFIRLKKHLTYKVELFEKNITRQAKNALNFLEEKNISPHSFYHSDWPNALKKLINGKFMVSPFGKRLKESMLLGRLYSKSCNDVSQKQLVDSYAQEILEYYNSLLNFYKKNFSEYLSARVFLRNISALALLCEIDKELSLLKKEKDLVFIEELNLHIAQWIKRESIPYIYERLGERYTHYFIDEFQDTSLMQWENFKPLIENVLSENGTAMIVGDVKQSIYRWRGAYPEQFLFLSQENQESYRKEVHCLKKNFRSLRNIICFNNELYSSASELLSEALYQEIYRQCPQESVEKDEGYVELNFLHSADNKSYYAMTFDEIQQRIKGLLMQGYECRDICLLVRKKKQGAFLAESLMGCQWPVISSESLLLKNAWTVKIALGYLQVLSRPEDSDLRVDWLLLLLQYNLLKPQGDSHLFLQTLTTLSFEDFFKELNREGLYFQGYLGCGYSLYELCEEVIRIGQLNVSEGAAALHFFLDVVYRAMNKGLFTLLEFLEWWHQRQDKERVIFPESLNAISIMTIHQAKGLQFPVVLLPFADWEALEEKKGGLWLEVDPNGYEGFDLLYANTNASMKSFKGKLKQAYEAYLSQVQFDHLNLLYVATTRAIEQLFIFSRQSKSQSSTVTFYLEHYLKTKSFWEPSKEIYKIGSSVRSSEKTSSIINQETLPLICARKTI
ncbi:UvrD-helicase domain-containing protein [Bacteroidetes bacterium endosymbiont of Geopemphigus sp.]|uniref:UvrD-helicase domain-containing protein n=1 Tax=Bacteroidetes bacterium endosymbiont of Geopemphigus sp. TaxID=2047937 RepID=UPI000CD1153C|nr:UvrD-helicase domain-containing protein [Bacteroidetes bacterium endosymbiont of Geopemphigus sp.]